jgi:hypothetical protein
VRTQDDYRNTFCKKVRAKVDRLRERKHQLEVKLRELEREIEDVLCGQSPFRIGDLIWWRAGQRERYGRVLAISSSYYGTFEYRVEVTTKDGARVIGQARVTESDQPELVN